MNYLNEMYPVDGGLLMNGNIRKGKMQEDVGDSPLTRREKEVLKLVAQGLTYQDIANHLMISPETVKKHISNIFGKLKVSNKVQAIRACLV